MVLRRNGTNQWVVNTVSKIPSSNAAVAQSPCQKKAVVKTKGHASSLAQLKKTSRLPMADKKQKSSPPATDASSIPSNSKGKQTSVNNSADKQPPVKFTTPMGQNTPKEDKSKFMGGRGPSIFRRSTSNILRRTGRSGLRSTPFPGRRSRSDLEHLRKEVASLLTAIDRHTMDGDSTTNGSPGSSQYTPASQKSVAFTREAIQTDLLNKQRKKQQHEHVFDPMSILSNLFCNVVPFSKCVGPHSTRG